MSVGLAISICTPYMTVCMAISLLSIPYIHYIYVHMCGFGQPLSFVRRQIYRLNSGLGKPQGTGRWAWCAIFYRSALTWT